MGFQSNLKVTNQVMNQVMHGSCAMPALALTFVVCSCLARCLMAWNEKTHVGVLAFRGTASMANAIADIQASVFRRDT